MPRLPLRTSLLAAVAGVALAAGAARRVLLVVTVEGTSMTPTYPPGTRLLVVRTPVARARTGAAVVFRLPPVERGGAEPPLIVKRVAARAGDPVPPAVRDAVGTRDGGRVPRGSVVLLGDDPATSTDSRAWGYVARRRISGVVVARLGPPAA
ncbi:S26 family signal peptidase [Streptomyces sp. NBC_01198]|uniref:S26 family signal peptidase n=1 Tax=Streptomyces sp. NBC_01198 TaxID=2903769 RepID=UPI002E155FC4|nr:S26 family signal peptidase [Streptomyces sp. NBC_01198]